MTTKRTSLTIAAEVALEAGNSPGMIFKHYRELVTEKEGKEWFSITPGKQKARGRRAPGDWRLKGGQESVVRKAEAKGGRCG